LCRSRDDGSRPAHLSRSRRCLATGPAGSDIGPGNGFEDAWLRAARRPCCHGACAGTHFRDTRGAGARRTGGGIMNLLDSLKHFTTVVADTGDIEAIAEHKPQDATTNPSLLFQAAQKPQYAHLVDDALYHAMYFPGERAARTEAFMDRLLVNFGCEILKIIPGRVSTEVDAGLSFDVEGTLAKAHKLIGMYEEAGIGRERILIKVASTWEGIRAAERLER